MTSHILNTTIVFSSWIHNTILKPENCHLICLITSVQQVTWSSTYIHLLSLNIILVGTITQAQLLQG
jgi:hypothetical protein